MTDQRGRATTRRRLIATAGALVGLAGCGGIDGNDSTPGPGGTGGNGDSGGTTSPPPTTTAPPTASPKSTEASTTPTATPEQLDRTRLEKRIAERANEIRAANGAGYVEWDEALREIARDWSWTMIRQKEVSHTDAMGRDWEDRYQAAGYRCLVEEGGPYRTGGECIARVTYEDAPDVDSVAADAVERLRQDRTGGTILASFWKNHGVGVALDPTVPETDVYVVQNFC